jgi:hypothetical protein
VECGWPFFRFMRKATLKQAKAEPPSDTVQLRHTGVTSLVPSLILTHIDKFLE